jgi:uncharacterized membrane protein
MTDEKLEQIVGNVLRSGVILSAAVVLAGGIWYLLVNGASVPNYHIFHGVPDELRSVRGIIAALTAPTPNVIIQFGLLLLIATPVTRVILCLVAFAVQRDRTYVVVTGIALAVLLYSLAVPHG